VYLERDVLLLAFVYMHAKFLLFVKPNNYKTLVVSLWGCFFFPFWPIFLVVGSSFDQCDWLSVSVSLSLPSPLSLSLPCFLFKKKTLRTYLAKMSVAAKKRKERKRKLIES
jgi:hypothetical protein